MNCSEVQRLLSREMDGAETPPGLLGGHLAFCKECRELRDAAGRIEAAYRTRVRAGVDRLRGIEGLPPWGECRKPRRKAVPRGAWTALAAAALLCLLWGAAGTGSPPPPAGILARSVSRTPDLPASPARPFSGAGDFQIAVLDEEDGGKLLREPALPVRLDQEWGSSGALDLDSPLPVSLRF